MNVDQEKSRTTADLLQKMDQSVREKTSRATNEMIKLAYFYLSMSFESKTSTV